MGSPRYIRFLRDYDDGTGVLVPKDTEAEIAAEDDDFYRVEMENRSVLVPISLKNQAWRMATISYTRIAKKANEIKRGQNLG